MKNRKLSFRSNSAYGFSVVELIVALTIMTIIVTVGFSAYTYFQNDYGKVADTLKMNSKNYDSIKTKIYSLTNPSQTSPSQTSQCENFKQDPSISSVNCIVITQPQN
jgi:prepilin-type N-terminal cleavage/methylation domain-containing protein